MIRYCLVHLLLAACPSIGFAQPFTNLLGDPSLSCWMKPNGDAVNGGWILQPDGTLALDGKGGNIISRRQYGDFELWFEFRIAKRGNSGIKYRVTKYGGSYLGCEYQILDDSAFPKLGRKNLTASLYDVFPTKPTQIRRNPDGQFNVGKIVVRGNRVRHWINGQLTIDECAGSARWNDFISRSKFRNKENFGRNHFGHIMLTDHGSGVWYRNLFIRPLSPPLCPEPRHAQSVPVNQSLAAN